MHKDKTYEEAIEMVSKKIRTYEGVSEELRDNHAFVLEVLKINREKKESSKNEEINIFSSMMESDIVYHSSERIQKMCEGQDPVQVLEKRVLVDELYNKLNNNQANNTQTSRMKI